MSARCPKPGCGALKRIGNPCTDFDCPQDWTVKELRAAGYRILAPGEMGTEARPFGFFFDAGDRVTKIKGSSWTGLVVGFYSTTLTQHGYCIESENEPGSVQLYPEAAIRSLGRRA